MLDNLNLEQLAAVTTNEPNLIILAPAGSGKTWTLINAVIEYRRTHLGESIDIITYTRAATAELKQRLAEASVYDVNVSTIHVWAREQLKDLDNLYHFHMHIIEEPTIMDILKMLINAHRTKIKAEILYSYVSGNKKMDVSDGYRRTLEALNERYIEYKRSNSLYDFTDYPLYLLDKLKQYNEYIYNTDAFFVDELQDVDEDQYQIFNRVQAKKKFFIGDHRQAIYIFRGADMEIFNKLEDFKKMSLTINYRSYQEIMDYAYSVYKKIDIKIKRNESTSISSVKTFTPAEISCARGNGGFIWILDYWGDTCLANGGSVDTHQAITNFLNKKPMVLCRTNKQVKALEALGWMSVSTVHQAKGLEYDNVILLDFNIEETEDLNIAYVGLTRAKDGLFIVDFAQFYPLLEKWLCG